MNITIRQVTENDYDFLFALKIETMKNYVEEVYGWDDKTQKDLFDRRFRPKDTRIIQCDGVDIGMYQLTEEDYGYWLRQIQISQEYQNQGIETRILKGILHEAEQENKALRLRVFKVNPARHLYEKLGFQTTDESETHYHMENTARQGHKQENPLEYH